MRTSSRMDQRTSDADPPEPDARPTGRSIPRLFRTFLEQAPEIDQFTLRFVDHDTEHAFQRSYQRDTLPYVRLAFVLGVAGWVLFGFLARRLVPEGGDVDTILRYGVAVPLTLVALACTYTAWWGRRWQLSISLVLVANALIWSVDRVALPASAPTDWGYAGMMVILAFIYVLSRLQFVYAAVVGAVSIVIYDVLTIAFASDTNTQFLVANYFLVTFAFVGMAASYGLDRSARLLFLRERQLDAARVRADELLHNTLPAAIVERLKARGSEPGVELLADGHEQVTVVFADLVSFTEHAERIAPAPLVAVLDEVFTMFDDLAQRVGMEKIKTVGDAYMAVAGAPEPRPDHAQAAAEMALQIRASMADARWPTGEPIQVRVGIATGPVVAGVIGRHRFAYDLWGDTVNLASRLESSGTPGEILVSETTAALLEGRYELGTRRVMQLKGKGATPAVPLIGRAS